MGLGYKPQVRVGGAGEDIINARLTAWERIDSSGVQSDQLTLHVDTSGQSGLPKEGAVLTWAEGYDDILVDKGQFTITRIIPVLFPPSVTIVATAAPFQTEDTTGFKERRTRSFEQISLADVFRQIVSAHGFSPRVADEFEGVFIEHIDQIDETDSAFLTRITKERDAIAKPVNDVYVLAKRGKTNTVTGKMIPTVIVGVPSKNTPSGVSQFTNCQLDKPSRRVSSGIKANWLDSNKGEENIVEVGTEPFKKLRQTYESQASATQACKDELMRLQREASRVSLDLPGSPKLVAEGVLTLNDTFPPEMAGDWSIDKVTARGDRGGGYRCTVIATGLV
ncbi:contractile injection system protein, VgrG/Pvc8 family [Marinomonas transparens]|uniref:Phage late control D family protein n=1 Tax=Marinomonas transparens TaxID=2795388 RepID=A0A934JIG0_9GAMM|nr:contractile injection system protein, VgrG/Pvc8 family [Marinomonas transparens]MBJ7536625.1 phage late control D family protein [Marinomonas transparens]